MHSIDPNSSNVPAFLGKLWKLVEDPDCDDLISWGEKGNTFIIRRQAAFARNMLPKYFKHNNMASFIRQLNMYGFRKVINYEKSGMNLENDEMEFCHQFFMKDSEHLLERIKRKIPTTKIPDVSAKATPNDILNDLTGIRERQENMNNILINMKKENELLWRELSSLRQKHKTQEQIIQKVIHFLVTIVQGSKQGIGMKRKVTHMLKDSPATSAKRSRHLEVVRGGKKPDFFISVSDDKATSPVGPVIHEVTELDHEEEIVDLVRCLPTVTTPSNSKTDTPADDNLSVLEPQSKKVSVSPIDNSEEEVLGLPVDFGCDDNNLLVCNNVSNVISIPENVQTKNSEVWDLMSISDGKSNVISIPDVSNVISIPEASNVITIPETSNGMSSIPEVSNVITIPEVSNVISIPESSGNNTITISSDGRVVLSPSVIPYSPSAVTVLSDENNTETVSEMSDVQLPEKSETKQPDFNIVKHPDAGKSILLPVVAQNVKESSVPNTGQKFMPSLNAVKKELYTNQCENQENAFQYDRQLAISDSNAPSETAHAKNTISNLVLSVDEELEFLQEQLNSGALSVDPTMLLGLFSSDEAVNNAVQTNQINFDASGVLKDTDSNIMGNELVQFTPSLLDVDLCDMETPLFLDDWQDDNEISMEDIKPTNCNKTPSIKQEKKQRNSCCLYENNPKGKLMTSLKSSKNSKGRGKRKAK